MPRSGGRSAGRTNRITIKMNEGEILVCFALPDEARPFEQLAATARVRTLITGIGKKNAERAIRTTLAESRPNLVLTCGFAGGLESHLTHGEIVFSADEESGLKLKLLAAGAREAQLFCADHIAVSAEEKRALRQKTGADAVEMESEIIRAVCREQKIPSATVRVISDIAGEDLPLDFNELMTPDRKLDFGKLTLAILKSPGKIGALLRLQKQTSGSAKILARTLAQIIAE